MPQKSRALFYSIGLWFLVNLLVRIYWFKLWNALYFFSGLVGIGITAIGPLLGVASLFYVFKERPRLPSVVALLLVIALSAFFFYDVSYRWGILARFYIEKLGYESTITKLFSAPNEAERNKICGVGPGGASGQSYCEVDIGGEGHPEQVVFPWTFDDVLMGWQGVVYDPSGSVMKAPRLGDNSPREGFHGKASFFGCALLQAQHLTGSWYYCHFWHR
jgi:hypothetical protein